MTAERQEGFYCPFEGCGMEHSLGDCSQDVTLAKVMERISVEVARYRPLTTDTPLQLVETVPPPDIISVDGTKTEAPRSRTLNGGRLVATYTMAELGELGYNAEVDYHPVSPGNDTYEELDVAMLANLKEEAKSELDCQVCYGLMLDPLTTNCGHTFCRKCVARILDHSNLCPICRRTLLMRPGAINEPSNKRLSDLLTSLYPDLLASRAEAASQEEQAMAGDTNVPLFPCTLAYPSMPTFLHIFEPRYRLMIRRAIENGEGRFGMVMYNSHMVPQGELGSVHFMQYGTLLQIRNMEYLPDGRSLIETVGISRFQVKSCSMIDGYIVGKIERLDDIPLAEEERIEASETSGPPAPPDDLAAQLDRLSTAQMLRESTDFLNRMRAASQSWIQARVIVAYGPPPDDPAIFPYWFASIVPVHELDKYQLLMTRSVRERLKMTVRWVRRMEAQQWYGPLTFLLPPSPHPFSPVARARPGLIKLSNGWIGVKGYAALCRRV
ncbi:MAG: hypothetical protein L6R38_002051 [Xanthoria sp. 2 TBL-2021]|nr:MAG: hypothetical protein L6R38_002051 [Xanthoria sp. 2 TBL-2021]